MSQKEIKVDVRQGEMGLSYRLPLVEEARRKYWQEMGFAFDPFTTRTESEPHFFKSAVWPRSIKDQLEDHFPNLGSVDVDCDPEKALMVAGDSGTGKTGSSVLLERLLSLSPKLQPVYLPVEADGSFNRARLNVGPPNRRRVYTFDYPADVDIGAAGRLLGEVIQSTINGSDRENKPKLVVFASPELAGSFLSAAKGIRSVSICSLDWQAEELVQLVGIRLHAASLGHKIGFRSMLERGSDPEMEQVIAEHRLVTPRQVMAFCTLMIDRHLENGASDPGRIRRTDVAAAETIVEFFDPL
ncbi:MAG: hypothetical protein ABID04_04015 [Patescibacteria group bacterium]